MTTADYLESLQSDLSTLKTNVEAKGVEVSEEDNFTTLAAKVADIPSGGGATDIYRVATTAERDVLTGVNEGDICVVYKDMEYLTNENSLFSLNYPQQIQTNVRSFNAPISFELSDGTNIIGGTLSYSGTEYSLYYGGSIEGGNAYLGVRYVGNGVSEEGIIFTREQFTINRWGAGETININGDNLEFVNPVIFTSGYTDELKWFFHDLPIFSGVYIYQNDNWVSLT